MTRAWNVVWVVVAWLLLGLSAWAQEPREGGPLGGGAGEGVKLPREEPEGTKAAVITIGDGAKDIIGLHVDRAWVKEMAARLEGELGNDHRGVLVVLVRSRGGEHAEARRIAEEVREEFLKRWRTVCWVEGAGGAAALAVYSIEEMVFTPRGWMGVGGGNGFREPEKPKDVMAADRRLSDWGGRDPILLRAMRAQVAVSATVERDGSVKWFEDEVTGEQLVNPRGNLLVLDAGLAEKVKFSAGTADTLEELRRLLGYEKVNWVGDRALATRERPWPVGKAERWNREHVAEVEREYRACEEQYRVAVEEIRAAAGVEAEKRGPMLERASVAIGEVRRMVGVNAAIGPWVYGSLDDEPLERLEVDVRRLRR